MAEEISEDEDTFDPDEGTVRVVNIGPGNMKFEIDGVRHVMRPKEVRPIPRAYATPRQLQPNAPVLPSVVELCTGRPAMVVPITHPRAAGVIAELEKTGKLDAGAKAELKRARSEA